MRGERKPTQRSTACQTTGQFSVISGVQGIPEVFGSRPERTGISGELGARTLEAAQAGLPCAKPERSRGEGGPVEIDEERLGSTSGSRPKQHVSEIEIGVGHARVVHRANRVDRRVQVCASRRRAKHPPRQIFGSFELLERHRTTDEAAWPSLHDQRHRVRGGKPTRLSRNGGRECFDQAARGRVPITPELRESAASAHGLQAPTGAGSTVHNGGRAAS